MMLSGPRNSSGLGNEQGVNNNAILKGQGGDHVTSSLITETGTATTFYTNALYVTSSNFVGIGTTSPAFTLDVNGTGRFSDTLSGSSATFTSTVIATAFIPTGSAVPVNGMYLPAANTLAFATSGTVDLTLTSAGNVGIGTTSPVGGGGASDRTLSINAATGAATFLTGLINGTRYSTLFTAADSVVLETNAAIPLVFNTNSTERMRITSGGNVGIGTTSPSLVSGGVGLTILGASYTQLRLESSNSSSGIEFKPSTGNAWEIQADTSSRFFIYNRSQTAFRFLIDTSGNVGIGTQTPSGRLHVYNSSAPSTIYNETYNGVQSYWNSSDVQNALTGGGFNSTNSVGDSLTFLTSAGTMTGTVYVYGMRK
jgi:hypothetical protein